MSLHCHSCNAWSCRLCITLLSLKPDLVTELDTQGFSPLHLASVNGYVEIVKKLLLVNTDTCLFCDEDGRTPLHLAVMKGRVDVINELIEARPEVIQYKLDRSETLLQSCVKHNRLGALKLLMELEMVDADFVNDKDDDGNTILHMATALKQMETIRYLLSITGVKVNAVNGNGFTALDILENTPRDFEGMEIRESLLNAGPLRARNIPASVRDTNQVITESGTSPDVVNREAVAPPSNVPSMVTAARPPSQENNGTKQSSKKSEDWLDKKREALIITATVIAAMAFQAGLNPPGGVWQDDKDHSAGSSVMADKHAHMFPAFWICNTASFLSSLSIILLLVCGLPLKQRFIIWILMIAMGVTITFMALAYLISMSAISPDREKKITNGVIEHSLILWVSLIVIVFLAQIVRFLVWWGRKVPKLRKKRLPIYATEGQARGNV